MKKLFLTLFAVVSTLATLATDYTGTLTVGINGVDVPSQQSTEATH